MKVSLKAPFPYLGGKSRIAETVWRALGNVVCYAEPFLGSAAVLLARKSGGAGCREVVNDLDCNVANFWRSIRFRPAETAEWAAWPTSHIDLFARRKYLAERQGELRELLASDVDSCDPKMAGMWCWCMASWIGTGMLKSLDGNCVLGQIPEVHHPVGIRCLRHRLNLGNGEGGGGISISCEDEVRRMFQILADRLANVCVLNDDWTRAVGGYLDNFGNGHVGVFLDPPYDLSLRDRRCYQQDGGGIAEDVRKWCVANGGKPNLRIVLCGYGAEHDELLDCGWRKIAWTNTGGWASMSKDLDNSNRAKERLWLSPACIGVEREKPAEQPEKELMLAFGD